MKVWVNGCFDCLHTGHFNLLMHARGLADANGMKGRVIVGVDEDEKVLISKGFNRPIFNEHERAKSILDLRLPDGSNVVDTVEFFITNTQLENIIRRIKPDIILKGGDWKDQRVIGAEYAKVVFYERIGEYSTTNIIHRVKNKNAVI